MATSPQPPVLINPFTDQITNVGSAFGPININDYIQSLDALSGKIKFTVTLKNGKPLPQGLYVSSTPEIIGIPAKGTEGSYDVLVIAENNSTLPFKTTFKLTILPRIEYQTKDGLQFDDDLPDEKFIRDLKKQIWDAIGHDKPQPDIGDLFVRPVRALDVLYLLERWATLTIWDAFNLDPSDEKHPIELEGCSPHYVVYDKGNCLIAAPVDLFSHQRTLGDAIQTAQAMAREVYKRGWTVEFSGYDKMKRAAWVELQLLGDHFGKQLDILHFSPNSTDEMIYEMRSEAASPAPKMNQK